ncbi:phosphoribulokinase [Thioalbus denitrificans]|uniref:phosphoribulokinase n=1 Tax=Thioalbus denitrificans TaxID=547122 RepID=A0A369BXH3_9GAMM|nr:phosphoribulokinase [Thioalbus denitrificans]RCX26041.1 phosphoribulokinase [Thioalbus denitrificans]
MSSKHPIIAVTGSSGAGTTTVRAVFEDIFKREAVNAVCVDGESFRRYDRDTMRAAFRASVGEGRPISHFGPEANLLDRLEGLFREYSRTGTGLIRRYAGTAAQAEALDVPEGSFTRWAEICDGTDLLFYEGLHGGCIEATWSHRHMSPSHNPFVIRERHRLETRYDTGIDVAQWVDLLIGVVPSINLEWIQKIHRDTTLKGASAEAVVGTIMRRLPDYIRYITPQFSLTDINFQRVPLVDTSNPFIARDVPSLAESILVIRFREPKRFDFPELLQRIPNAFMSRPNTLVVPGGEMEHALRVICTPLVHELVERMRHSREL